MPAPLANSTSVPGYLTPTTPPQPADLNLDTIIGGLIQGVTGLPATNVLPRWQPIEPRIPPVTETWCAVGVNISTPDDTPALIHDNGGFSVLRTFYRLDVLASFYGPLSDAYARLTHDSFYVDQNRDAMRANGLNLIGFDPIRRIPEVVAAQSRRRSDLAFRLIQRVERTYNILNILQVVGTIEAAGGSANGPVQIIDAIASPLPPA